jgi:hypothetical protein
MSAVEFSLSTLRRARKILPSIRKIAAQDQEAPAQPEQCVEVLIAAVCRIGDPTSERDEEYPAEGQQE